jgi:hypothetical protein
MNAPFKLASTLDPDSTADECEVDYGRACPTIPEAEYQAVFTHHETALSFNTPKVFLWFRIIEPGPYFGMNIYRAYRVRKLKSKPGRNSAFKVAANSDLFTSVTKVLDERGRPDRFSLQRLKGVILKILTRTVKRDHKQREIPEARRYSVVETILRKETG